MFGRFVGHYAPFDIRSALTAERDVAAKLEEHLPELPTQFFGSAREALSWILKSRRLKSDKEFIVIPGWGCPIVLAVVLEAGFKPLLLDVAPETMHMDLDEIKRISEKYPVDSVILVAENGIPYDVSEVAALEDSGITTISDYALAWQNGKDLLPHNSQYEIYSGGFSKPVSGLGLGVLVSQSELEKPTLQVKSSGSSIPKVMVHLLLQNRLVYRVLQPIIPNDLEDHFNGQLFAPSLGSQAIVLSSLQRAGEQRATRYAFQEKISEVLEEFDVSSTLLRFPQYLHAKVVLPAERLVNGKREIEFHKQYKKNLLDDSNAMKVDSDYENIHRLRKDYISFSLSPTFLNAQNRFLVGLRKSFKK